MILGKTFGFQKIFDEENIICATYPTDMDKVATHATQGHGNYLKIAKIYLQGVSKLSFHFDTTKHFFQLDCSPSLPTKLSPIRLSQIKLQLEAASLLLES